MADRTEIEWTDATWNPITGCSVVSPGCKHCYAMRLAGGRLKNHPSRRGLTEPTAAGPVWNGKVRLNKAWLTAPLRWRNPKRIFVCAHGDLFHEAVPVEWIDLVHAVTVLAPQHIFQVLTKRSGRMMQYYKDPELQYYLKLAVENLQGEYPGDAGRLPHIYDGQISIDRAGYIDSPWHATPRPNIWLGVSVEDLRREQRIVDLLQTPAALRFVSFEPLLENVSPDRIPMDLRGLDWVIVGGESGPGARPMDPDWVRRLRDRSHEQEVAFFFKQWGGPRPKSAGRLLDGVLHDSIPERLDDGSWLIPLQHDDPDPAFRVRHPDDEDIPAVHWNRRRDPARCTPDGRPPGPKDLVMMFRSPEAAVKRAKRTAVPGHLRGDTAIDIYSWGRPRKPPYFLVMSRGAPDNPARSEKILCQDGRWRHHAMLPDGRQA